MVPCHSGEWSGDSALILSQPALSLVEGKDDGGLGVSPSTFQGGWVGNTTSPNSH